MISTPDADSTSRRAGSTRPLLLAGRQLEDAAGVVEAGGVVHRRTAHGVLQRRCQSTVVSDTAGGRWPTHRVHPQS